MNNQIKNGRTAALALLVCVFALAGCGTKDKPAADASDGGGVEANGAGQYALSDAGIIATENTVGKKPDVIEIKEKMFIAQTNEIYINTKDYLGRTIKYEGIFHEAASEGGSGKYYYVIRYGPGCCPGDVSAAGFEVEWDKGYPKQNDWVEAAGILEQYDDNGIPALRLALKSLTVLTTRGKERVTR
jgi:uncharacterized membrane protein YcgQ (UPF0703/DUF1980 family)